MSLLREEAERRIRVACDLIASAHRLHPLEPGATLASVQSAIAEGAERMAEDIREEAQRGT